MHPTFYTYELPSALQIIGDVLCSNVVDRDSTPYMMHDKVSASSYTSADTMHITQQTNANIKRNRDKCRRTTFYVTNTESGFNPFCHHTKVVFADQPLAHGTNDCRKTAGDTSAALHRRSRAIIESAMLLDPSNVYQPSRALITGDPGKTVTRYVTENNGIRRVYTIDPTVVANESTLISDKVNHVVAVCEKLAMGLSNTNVEKVREHLAAVILGDPNPDRLVTVIRQKYRQMPNTNTHLASYKQFLDVAERLGYVKKGAVAGLGVTL